MTPLTVLISIPHDRSLYLSSPRFDPAAHQIDNPRLTELKHRFKETLKLYFHSDQSRWRLK